MKMLRFMSSVLAGLVAGGAIIGLAEALVLNDIAGALAGTGLGGWLALRIHETGSGEVQAQADRRGLRPTMAITFAFALAMHLTVVHHLDGVRPLASFTFGAVAALLFAALGYWRLATRR